MVHRFNEAGVNMVSEVSNDPAAGKAGIARLTAVGDDCPGLPEPGRSA
jgi:hypothetical protein